MLNADQKEVQPPLLPWPPETFLPKIEENNDIFYAYFEENNDIFYA